MLDGDATTHPSAMFPKLTETQHQNFHYTLCSNEKFLDATEIKTAINEGNLFGPGSVPCSFSENIKDLDVHDSTQAIIFERPAVVQKDRKHQQINERVLINMLTGRETDLLVRNTNITTFDMPPLVSDIQTILDNTGVEGFSANTVGWLSQYRAITRQNVSGIMNRHRNMTGGCLRTFYLKMCLDFFTSKTIEVTGGVSTYQIAGHGPGRLTHNNVRMCDVQGEALVLTPANLINIEDGHDQLFSIPDGYQSAENVEMIARYCSSYPVYRAAKNKHGGKSHLMHPVAQKYNIQADAHTVFIHTGFQSCNALQGIGAVGGYISSDRIRAFMRQSVVITDGADDFTWAWQTASLMMCGLPNSSFSRADDGSDMRAQGCTQQATFDTIVPTWTDNHDFLPKMKTAYAYFNCYRERAVLPLEVGQVLGSQSTPLFISVLYKALCVSIARQVAYHCYGLSGAVLRSSRNSANPKISTRGLHVDKVLNTPPSGSFSHLDEVTTSALHSMFGFIIPEPVLTFFRRPLEDHYSVINYCRGYQIPTPVDTVTIATLARVMPIAWDIPHQNSVIRRPVNMAWLNDSVVSTIHDFAFPYSNHSDEQRPFTPDEDLMRNLNLVVWRANQYAVAKQIQLVNLFQITTWTGRAIWEIAANPNVKRFPVIFDRRSHQVCAGIMSNNWLGKTKPAMVGLTTNAQNRNKTLSENLNRTLRQLPIDYSYPVLLPNDSFRGTNRYPTEIVYPQIEILRPNIPISKVMSKMPAVSAAPIALNRTRIVTRPDLVNDQIPQRPAFNYRQTVPVAVPLAPQHQVNPPASTESMHSVDSTLREHKAMLDALMTMMSTMQQTLKTNMQSIAGAVYEQAVDPPHEGRERINVNVDIRDQEEKLNKPSRNQSRRASPDRGRSHSPKGERPQSTHTSQERKQKPKGLPNPFKKVGNQFKRAIAHGGLAAVPGSESLNS